MHIMATVIAVRAAMRLMACSAVKKVVKNAIKETSETNITAVPMAKFLRLNSFSKTSDSHVQLGLF